MRKLFMLIFCLIMVIILGLFTVDTRQNAIVENQITGSKKVCPKGIYFTMPFFSKIVYVYMNQRTLNYTFKLNNYEYTFMTTWRVIDPEKYYDNLDKKSVLIASFESATINNVSNIKEPNLLITQDNLLTKNYAIESLGIEIQGMRLVNYTKTESINTVANKVDTNNNDDMKALESSYYLAQKIKTEADVNASKMYLSLQKNDPKFYDYYRLLEVYKRSAKSKKDVPPLSELYQ